MRLILDFDATDTPLHGDQEGRFFHGYYDHYCFLRLYVFCGPHLLASYQLRSSGHPAPRPDTPGLSRHWNVLRWCERYNVKYIGGIAKNIRLIAKSALWREDIRKQGHAKRLQLN